MLVAAACVFALVACSAPARETVTNHDEPAVGAPRSDEEAIARRVIDDYLDTPDWLPDRGLLPTSGPVYVLAEVGPHATLHPAVLPAGFEPRTATELQTEADRRKAGVAYVRIFVRVDGDHAEVVQGVDVAVPAGVTSPKLCCCRTSTEYVKRSGRWRTTGTMSTVCA